MNAAKFNELKNSLRKAKEKAFYWRLSLKNGELHPHLREEGSSVREGRRHKGYELYCGVRNAQQNVDRLSEFVKEARLEGCYSSGGWLCRKGE